MEAACPAQINAMTASQFLAKGRPAALKGTSEVEGGWGTVRGFSAMGNLLRGIAGATARAEHRDECCPV